MSDILPDAAPDNWVDRFAPAGVRPWLKLARLDRPAGIWLLLLPGWWGIALAGSAAGRLPDARLLALFAVGAVLMRSAGCAFNDIVDRDIDRQVARTAGRPLASGAIGMRGAWGFVVACCLVSFGILLTLGPAAIVLGVASLALVAAYPFMKRITWWPQAWLGLTFNWGALMGYAAALGGVSGAAWLIAEAIRLTDFYTIGYAMPAKAAWHSAILLYLAGVFWTLGYDTIYAVQDLEDDALAGVKSSARRLGGKVRTGVGVFYGLSLACAFGAGWAGGLGPGFLVGWAVFAGHLSWQAARVRVDDPQLCLRLFRSNRDAGLILFAAIVAGGVWR